MILDRSRNKEHQDLQLSTNLYITPPKVQNKDRIKIVLKSLEITRKRLEHNSRSKQKQGATRFALQDPYKLLSNNYSAYQIIIVFKIPVQNEDPG